MKRQQVRRGERVTRDGRTVRRQDRREDRREVRDVFPSIRPEGVRVRP